MISRVQEKNELAGLNDRLASYIDKVRQLEFENSRLSRIVHSQEDTVTKEVTGIKGLYEGELTSARKLLDDMAKDKAKLQFENGKLKAELEDLHSKLRTKETDLAASEKKLLSAEAQANELQARLNDAINQRRHFEDEFNKLKKELDLLNKSLSVAKKQLEDETIQRVDLENRIQSLKEELAFKSQIFEQELNESVSRSRVVVEEADGILQHEYENKLGAALKEMREDMEEQMRKNREDTEAVFEKRLAELRELSSRGVNGSGDKMQAEFRNAQKHIEELNAEIVRLNMQRQDSEARLRDLENQLRKEQDSHAIDNDMLNAEIQRLRKQNEEQLAEYRDLMDIKIQLDAEIAAYRKLLESEESRLNLSTVEGTPGRTPAEPSRKRQRTELDTTGFGAGASASSSTMQSSSDFSVSSSAKDAVEISETCTDGKFVKLLNTSADKEISLGGWVLKHVSGGQETMYKFHRTSHIKPQQTVTVWSSNCDQTHSPPSNLVMKDQRWFAGDDMRTVLLDTKGEEMASRSLKRAAMRTSTLLVRSAPEATPSSAPEKRKSWSWSLFRS
jgi:chromosome segregation ATPase